MGLCASSQPVHVEQDQVVVGKPPQTIWTPPNADWKPPEGAPPPVQVDLAGVLDSNEPEPEIVVVKTTMSAQAQKIAEQVGQSLEQTFIKGKNGDAPDIVKAFQHVGKVVKNLTRSEEMRRRQEEEDRKTKAVQEEMEKIRLRKLKEFEEKHVEPQEAVQEREAKVQEELKVKAEETRIEEEWRQKKRDEELAKQRKVDEENAKKREVEKQLLKKKIDSGKKLSEYEQKMAKLYFEEQPKAPPSPSSDRPKVVSRLSESQIINVEAIKIVMETLEKKHEETAEQAKTTASIEPVLEDLRKEPHSMLEFRFNVNGYFHQFTTPKDPVKEAASAALVEAIFLNPQLELVEMYGSGLDDHFLSLFAAKLKDKNVNTMAALQEIHMETNMFTSKGLVPLFESLCQRDRVPKLTCLKLANQKNGVDTASEMGALQVLKDNPWVNRLTFDFRSPIVLAEANRLLARNGALAKAEGRSSLSRSSLSAGNPTSTPKNKPKSLKDISFSASRTPRHEDEESDEDE